MSQNRQLAHLRPLLENLPDSIPYHDLKSTCYSSSVADNEIEEYGDETSAANRRLEAISNSLTKVPQARILIESSNSMAASISASPFLHDILLDERPATNSEGIVPPTWKRGATKQLRRSGKICNGRIIPFLTISNTVNNQPPVRICVYMCG
jgi:hypothetical protein